MQDLPTEETIRSALQASHARLRKQHELFVQFGVESLACKNYDSLQTKACEVVARGMCTTYAKILKYRAEDDQFVLAAGVGWAPEDIGNATVGADEGSPAGYSYMTERPVISNHLGQEHRFRTPSLLKKYGIERAINVPIRGTAAAIGILEADSSDGEDFIESDLVFMEGIANILSMTAERLALSKERFDDNPYSESVLNSSLDCVKIISRDGHVEFFNESGLCLMGLDHLDQVKGTRWDELWPMEARTLVLKALSDAAQGNTHRFESCCPTAKGEPKWWDVTVSPIRNNDNQIEKFIAVSRDISERHAQESMLKALIDAQSERLDQNQLMMEEVHHRVRNSLHLVNALLLLQANMSHEEPVKLQLQTAARRVLAVSSVHEHLNHSRNYDEADPRQYLERLLQDIGQAFGDRPIHLNSTLHKVPAERLAPLGFIISELVVNAMKYGKGDVTVDVAEQADHGLVTVIDQGDGFPDTYPKPTGTGLGTRLVKNYAGFGSDAISVDRTAPTSTIRVKFRL